jgi:hypothetical protein
MIREGDRTVGVSSRLKGVRTAQQSSKSWQGTIFGTVDRIGS